MGESISIKDAMKIPTNTLDNFKEGWFLGFKIKSLGRDDLLAIACHFALKDEAKRESARNEVSSPSNWYNKIINQNK